ncbi:MAG TPA: helix-turn-helix domain-containing protein [Gaiellaceae bacterium]|jgi:DNA-binding HxlR family transcriptional regulator|nr:helix-turn-helix domain-containing protein [Gaiellaceae bacterium]
MAKRYDQYCAIAHALELVGERWSLLIVRELLTGPKRYTDLSGSLPHIGTNVLAARLKELEAGGIVTKRKLPPPAPAQVYQLTPYGESLKPVMRELALWGIRSIGAPEEGDEFAPGWLEGALDMVFAPMAPSGSFEFRVGDQVAALVDGEARAGAAEQPDVVVESDPKSFYYLFVERRWDGVTVHGSREQLEQLLDAVAPVPSAPVAA